MNSDRNAAQIVSALRAAGALVVYLDPEGGNGRGGLPDLLVAYAVATAGGCAVHVVRDVATALAAIGLVSP